MSGTLICTKPSPPTTIAYTIVTGDKELGELSIANEKYVNISLNAEVITPFELIDVLEAVIRSLKVL